MFVSLVNGGGRPPVDDDGSASVVHNTSQDGQGNPMAIIYIMCHVPDCCMSPRKREEHRLVFDSLCPFQQWRCVSAHWDSGFRARFLTPEPNLPCLPLVCRCLTLAPHLRALHPALPAPQETSQDMLDALSAHVGMLLRDQPRALRTAVVDAYAVWLGQPSMTKSTAFWREPALVD